MKIILLCLSLIAVMLLSACNINDGVGNIFNAIWGSKFTPYIIMGVIVIYILNKRNQK